MRPWVDVGGVAAGNNSTELRLSEGWARLVSWGADFGETVVALGTLDICAT